MSNSIDKILLLTKEQCSNLAKIMNIKYSVHLKNRTFNVESWKESHLTSCAITLRTTDDSYYYKTEAYMDHISQGLDAQKATHLLLDYLDEYFNCFLSEDENTYIPIDWHKTNFSGYNLYIRGQILNLKAEKMADELLALHS